MKKTKIPTRTEIQVHSETGGEVEYVKVIYGAVYPNNNGNSKAPAFKGKCTLEINNKQIEIDLAIWEQDYGLSLQGTLIRLLEGNRKSQYE
jgi:hypothetical protein